MSFDNEIRSVSMKISLLNIGKIDSARETDKRG